ncbi:MAG: hypothetical protein KDC53_14055 [Saprospiraceae bacterium]|nr:hypothetical protein [Saprospiraceae bacterium]
MYKYLLQSVENINWLAIIPLLIFFIFFVSVTIIALRKNKSYVDKMGRLPLEEE